MIRLVVSGAADNACRKAALRLRGATLAASLDPTTCDAAVFVGAVPPEHGAIECLLQAKKHVFLATEACLSGDVMESLAAVARQGGVQFAIENPDHYLPSRQLLRRQLDTGKLGAAGLVRIHRWEPAAVDGRRTFLGFHAALVRDLELAVWLMGKPPNLVYAVGAVDGRYLQVHLGFPDGGMALIDHCERLPPGDGYQSVSVIGSAGAAYADDHQNMQLLYRGGNPQAVQSDEAAEGLSALVLDFVDALRTGRELRPTVAVWRATETILAAMRCSLELRQAVPLEGG